MYMCNEHACTCSMILAATLLSVLLSHYVVWTVLHITYLAESSIGIVENLLLT